MGPRKWVLNGDCLCHLHGPSKFAQGQQSPEVLKGKPTTTGDLIPSPWVWGEAEVVVAYGEGTVFQILDLIVAVVTSLATPWERKEQLREEDEPRGDKFSLQYLLNVSGDLSTMFQKKWS